MNEAPFGETLTWDDSYAIARALRCVHPHIDLEGVTLRMIFEWTVALPSFGDEPELANDVILQSIFQEWFEEENPV